MFLFGWKLYSQAQKKRVYRIFTGVNDDTGMQVDAMPVLHGIKSFKCLRSDAIEVEFEGYKIKAASLRAKHS